MKVKVSVKKRLGKEKQYQIVWRWNKSKTKKRMYLIQRGRKKIGRINPRHKTRQKTGKIAA